jgi:hypothetical protein
LIDVGNDCLRIGTGVIPFVDVRRHWTWIVTVFVEWTDLKFDLFEHNISVPNLCEACNNPTQVLGLDFFVFDQCELILAQWAHLIHSWTLD